MTCWKNLLAAAAMRADSVFWGRGGLEMGGSPRTATGPTVCREGVEVGFDDRGALSWGWNRMRLLHSEVEKGRSEVVLEVARQENSAIGVLHTKWF